MRALIALLALCLAACSPRPFELTLVFSHGLMGGLEPCACPASPPGGISRLATHLKSLQGGPPVVLIDGGDTFFGTALAERDGGRAMIAAMNRLGYAAMMLGEQDLNGGPLGDRIAGAKFPVLSPERTTAIVTMGDRRIGLVGIGPNEGLALATVLERARDEAERLRSQTDLLVGISHLRLRDEAVLVKALPELDMLFGAHPRGSAPVKTVGKTLVVPGSALSGKVLSAVRLRYDPVRRRIAHHQVDRLTLGAEVEEDPEWKQWLASLRPSQRAEGPEIARWNPGLSNAPGILSVICWCLECQDHLENLARFSTSHPEQPLRILSLLPEDETRHRLRRLGHRFETYVDPDGAAYRALGSPRCPHTVVWGPGGEKKAEIRGSVTRKRLEAMIR